MSSYKCWSRVQSFFRSSTVSSFQIFAGLNGVKIECILEPCACSRRRKHSNSTLIIKEWSKALSDVVEIPTSKGILSSAVLEILGLKVLFKNDFVTRFLCEVNQTWTYWLVQVLPFADASIFFWELNEPPTYILKWMLQIGEASRFFWGLKNLKHIELFGCSNLKMRPHSFGKLTVPSTYWLVRLFQFADTFKFFWKLNQPATYRLVRLL